MSTDTRDRLLHGTIEALRTQGIAGVSARTIAAAAGVNQALVFYHFGSVDELLAAASVWSTEQQVAAYRERFGRVQSLRELQRVGRELHLRESANGNVTVLGQMLAGAQTNPAYAAATRDALALWNVEIEQVLTRVLADSPLGEVADVPGLARAVAASFIGMELLAAVDPEGDQAAFRALDQLGALLEYLDDLGPAARVAARRAVRTAVRRSVRA
ncbi:TetR/AcrR family transcriptional regulator [Catenulispora sp. NF23]|uniref:TetR/AcrR family transcriptional regulator n=1 Tax=Catenulispora pinistramenti TaxID=2705254 RepID=A0ABS5KS19_9ACTN|nr:TetR/AcrR family transcriptional regulator [Catenulispora pinistramenti]MBS2534527.1 TetR/AcrR family transcriptional regulator [Catenulispora pinistramenti]MBS2548848.1 TetR/AcrR family transcriptional regulator [Catenulispora pinistramenti]